MCYKHDAVDLLYTSQTDFIDSRMEKAVQQKVVQTFILSPSTCVTVYSM